MTAVACEPSVPAMNQMWSDAAHVAAPSQTPSFHDSSTSTGCPSGDVAGLPARCRPPLVAPSGVVEELAR